MHVPPLLYVINAAKPALPVDSGIDGFSQPLDDGVDRAAVDNERRRQQHVVAAVAIDCSSHRINHQSARHRFALDPRIHFALRIERFLGSTVGYNLEPLKQPAAAHVADKRMIAEPLLQPPRQMRALRPDIGKQTVAADDPLHGKRGRAGERMAGIGVAMLESAGAFRDGLEDALLQQYRADRYIAAAQSLCDS